MRRIEWIGVEAGLGHRIRTIDTIGIAIDGRRLIIYLKNPVFLLRTAPVAPGG